MRLNYFWVVLGILLLSLGIIIVNSHVVWPGDTLSIRSLKSVTKPIRGMLHYIIVTHITLVSLPYHNLR